MSSPSLQGFRSVRGHGAVLELLRRAIAHDRVASVYLFAGAQGVGKDRVAHALAQTLDCRARTEALDACGACDACRKIATGVHPDLLVVQRELKEAPREADAERRRAHRIEDVAEAELRPNITVEQVEELLARMPFRPHEGAARVVIVREADKLLPTAANKLLKTLEEPPRDTHFVLVTHKPSMLLPTIRSRCQVIRFGLLDAQDVAAVLTDLSVDPSLAALGDGSVGRALTFGNPEELKARQAIVDEVLACLRVGHPGAFVALGERVKELDKRELDAVLTLLQRHFRAEATQHADAAGRRAAVNAARGDLVREAQEQIESGANLNMQLVFEAMLVKLREARA